MTGLLAGIGLALAAGNLWLVWRTGKTLERQREAMDRTVGAAEESVALAQGTARHQLRGYVTVRQATVECHLPAAILGSTPFVAKIAIRNHGVTPVFRVVDRTWIRPVRAECPFDHLPWHEAPGGRKVGDLGPKRGVVQFYEWAIEDASEVPRLRNAELWVAVLGWVEYEDIYGEKHETRFAFYFHPGVASGAPLAGWPGGMRIA